MKKFQSVRGMKDIMQIESKAYRALENKLILAANQYGFNEIKTQFLRKQIYL